MANGIDTPVGSVAHCRDEGSRVSFGRVAVSAICRGDDGQRRWFPGARQIDAGAKSRLRAHGYASRDRFTSTSVLCFVRFGATEGGVANDAMLNGVMTAGPPIACGHELAGDVACRNSAVLSIGRRSDGDSARRARTQPKYGDRHNASAARGQPILAWPDAFLGRSYSHLSKVTQFARRRRGIRSHIDELQKRPVRSLRIDIPTAPERTPALGIGRGGGKRSPGEIM